MYQIKFGSKAETLNRLKAYPLPCIIPDFVCFTITEWQKNRENVLKLIAQKFSKTMVAIRSSAVCEDGVVHSNAGAFTSVLNIDPFCKETMNKAVENVFDSYTESQPDDQVIVQKMVQKISVSGVILTRCVDDGSPYYVINYDDESGTSDAVTSGKGVHKTVLVYRNFKTEYCDSQRVKKMLDLARSIETFCGVQPLDIEFILDKTGAMYLLQVRLITTASRWHPDAEHRVSRLVPHVERFVNELSDHREKLWGDYTLLGNMPDWNPAELIGVIPRPLAASLFRDMITSSVWREARARMGYHRLPCTELMVMIAGRPFIDVRASFNSFLPDGISRDIGSKLVNAWLNLLSENPMLHDKVEFEIVHTILDFNFEKTWRDRYSDILSTGDKECYHTLLKSLTNKILDLSKNGSLDIAIKNICLLNDRQIGNKQMVGLKKPVALATHISTLLEDCRCNGTLPFSIIARHAFIAEAFLRSAVERGALMPERANALRVSIRTVMGEMASDIFSVCQGQLEERIFMDRYGHLRPGTFDIMSPCYRDRSDIFINEFPHEIVTKTEPFVLTSSEEQALNFLLTESGIFTLDAQGLLSYIQQAIKGREYAKFVFTRHLSAALEIIAIWGAHHGLGREDLSFLNIQDILDTCYRSPREEITTLLMHKVDQARLNQDMSRIFKLSYLIRGVQDIHVVPVHRSEPNFITSENVERPAIFLRTDTLNYNSLKGNIVCIENADPGFDWIFTKGISGLITQYGGANSHMTIRCAELKLPAAIGCGEVLFERLRGARKISLDCRARIVTPIGIYE